MVGLRAVLLECLAILLIHLWPILLVHLRARILIDLWPVLLVELRTVLLRLAGFRAVLRPEICAIGTARWFIERCAGVLKLWLVVARTEIRGGEIGVVSGVVEIVSAIIVAVEVVSVDVIGI